MNCPKCNVPMIRRKSKFNSGYWHGCSNYPKCKITWAENPDSTMLSTPADEEVKKLRKEAHMISEEIWGKWESYKCKKREMYDWLKYNTTTGHFGKMEKESNGLKKNNKNQKFLNFNF